MVHHLRVPVRTTDVFNRVGRFLVPVMILATMCVPGFAADIVIRKDSSVQLVGQITGISSEGITMEIGSKKAETKVPANEIARVRFDGEPALLNSARNKEEAGHLAEALDAYEEFLASAPAGARHLRTDLEFLIARTSARIALADPSLIAGAVQKLDAFRKAHPDSYRYYESLGHLMKLHMARKDYNAAKVILALMQNAPWPEYQSATRIDGAMVQLYTGDPAGALAAFDEVIAMPATTAAEKNRRFEAVLGKASGLQQLDRHQEALAALEALIREAPQEDAALLAEVYVRQGDSYLATGQNKPALLAYLHVDVLYESEAGFHAEALYRLVSLWGTLGQPARAADAAERLKSQYPNSKWAKEASANSSK